MVSGPEGYCVEQRASRESAEGDFVLLASCAALTGREGGASAPAILTASVSGEPGGRGPMPEAFPILADFFRTDQGRAALSRSGRVGDVEVLRSYSRGDALYLKLRDRSPASGVPVEPDYWRAILGLGGRIVTLSVLSARQRPMTDATRQNTLQAFVARMQGVNRSANAS